MKLPWSRRKSNDLDAMDVLNMDDYEVGRSYMSYNSHWITRKGYDYYNSDGDKLKILLLGIPFSLIAGPLLSKLFHAGILMSIVFGIVFFGVYFLVQKGLLSKDFYWYAKRPFLIGIDDLIYKNNPVRLLVGFDDLKYQYKLYAISNAFYLLNKNMFEMNYGELGRALKMIAPIISFRDKYEQSDGSYDENYIRHLNDLAYKIQLEKNMNLLVDAVNDRRSREKEETKSYNKMVSDREDRKQDSYIDSITDSFNDYMGKALKDDKVIKESNDLKKLENLKEQLVAKIAELKVNVSNSSN